MHLKYDASAIELNRDAINIHSRDRRDIRLPYHGEVPRCRDEPREAWIYMNVKPFECVRMILMVQTSSETERFPVQADAEEVDAIMQELFSNPNSNTSGLDPYWEGVWHANYLAWHQEQVYKSIRRTA